jgi:hypothetical protein
MLQVQDRERVAIGWLMYVFFKWMFNPNPSTFSQLPTYIRPVAMQIERGQHKGLPFLLWPKVKANLVENWSKYNFGELMQYLTTCTKVRWPWFNDYLERDSDDNILLKREFYETFIHPDGWGLTSEFIERYPELLEGMDVEAVRWDLRSP